MDLRLAPEELAALDRLAAQLRTTRTAAAVFAVLHSPQACDHPWHTDTTIPGKACPSCRAGPL